MEPPAFLGGGRAVSYAARPASIGFFLKRMNFPEKKGRDAMKKLMMLLATLLCLVSVAQAAELTVDPAGQQGQYATITEALAAAQSGDTIVLQAGLYAEPAETFPLKIEKTVTIRAAEGQEAVVEAPMFTNNFEIYAPNVTLENLTINLRRWGVLCLADGLTLRNNRIELINLARRTSTNGVWMAGAKHAVIENNEFIQCGLSMAGPPVSESSAGLPVLTALFEVGEDIEFFTSHTVENNTVNGKPLYLIVNQEKAVVPQDAGSFIAANCDHVLVDGVDVSYGSMGMIIVNCGDVEIRNARADFCGLFGVYLAKVYGGGLLDNVTTEGTNHGLDIRACKNVVVQNCHVVNCDQGIFFSMSDDCIVQNCAVEGGAGGFFFAVGHNNHVINCTVHGAQNGARCEKETAVYFINNRMWDNSLAAIRFDRAQGVLIGNEFTNNNVGLIAYGDKPLAAYDNRFIGTKSSGIYLNGVGGGFIVNNVFEETKKVTIQAEKNVGVMFVKDNVIDTEIVDHSVEGMNIE